MVSEPLAPGIALDPVHEALDDIGDFFEEAWDDTRDFIKDHPIISGALAIATGTWFISAAGGFAAAGAKLATGITNVIGSFTPTISSTSVGASINVGSFASASVGAGVNGLTAFAGANVSILGVPVWGVGSSLSALGSFGTTIGGSITNNLLGGPSLFGSGGSIDVGSFAKATVNSTLTVLANESGLTTVHDAFHATRETAQDIYRALAPPPPPVIMQPVSYGASGLTPVEGTPDLQSVGPTGGNPFSGLGDWPTFDVSQGYYESGSGDYNGTRLVGYPSSAPQSEGFSWESDSHPFVIDWKQVSDYGTQFSLEESVREPIRTQKTFDPYDGFRQLSPPGPGEWLSTSVRVSSDCISGRDTYSCEWTPSDSTSASWLSDQREQQAFITRTLDDISTIRSGFNSTPVVQEELLGRAGFRRVRWQDRPGFSPIIQDVERNGAPYKVIWNRASRPNHNGPMVASEWDVVPGSLSDNEAVSVYTKYFDNEMRSARNSVAMDVAMLAGGEFLSVLRFGRVGATSKIAPSRGPQLVHMTPAREAIEQSRKLGLPSDLYAGPISNANRSGFDLTLRTGLDAGKRYEPIYIPSAAESVFRKPLPIGPGTLWQRSMGTQYAPRGVIDLGTGAFQRTGINRTQALWYSIDATITTGAGAYWWSTTTEDQQ